MIDTIHTTGSTCLPPSTHICCLLWLLKITGHISCCKRSVIYFLELTFDMTFLKISLSMIHIGLNLSSTMNALNISSILLSTKVIFCILLEEKFTKMLRVLCFQELPGMHIQLFDLLNMLFVIDFIWWLCHSPKTCLQISNPSISSLD